MDWHWERLSIMPWIGSVSLKVENQINKAIVNFVSTLMLRVVYITNFTLPSIQKEWVPTNQTNFVV